MGYRRNLSTEPIKRTVQPPRRPAPLPLRVAVLGLAGLAMASAGGLVVAHLRPGLLLSPRSVISDTPAAASTTHHRASGSASTSTTSPPTPGAPQLLALVPAHGTTGNVVTIEGHGLFSADGSIIATFDGVQATTRCPSEERCLVTVPPPQPGSSVVSVVLRTSAGTSNLKTFRYG